MTHLRILAPSRYPWTFNGPRHSCHLVERRHFVPLNHLSYRIEGVTWLNPFPLRHFNLMHAYNRIPMTTRPFVIGFESHLPRAYGLHDTAYFRYLTRILAGPRCKAIVAISRHAREIFQSVHEGSEYAGRLFAKLQTRYPSVEIADIDDPLRGGGLEPLTISFVGNHFGRKGGCVAVRLAELALERKFPLNVEVASSLVVGANVWTDPVREGFFDPYIALLGLPNVRWYRDLSNRAVIDLFRRSHLSLLTTFSDSFGFSAIESMGNWAPVVATRQGALPEFVISGRNGFILDLPTSQLGEWVHSNSPIRATKRYEAIFAEEVDRLARQTFDEIVDIAANTDRLFQMRHHARQTAIELFDSHAADRFWDDLYVQAVA